MREFGETVGEIIEIPVNKNIKKKTRETAKIYKNVTRRIGNTCAMHFLSNCKKKNNEFLALLYYLNNKVSSPQIICTLSKNTFCGSHTKC